MSQNTILVVEDSPTNLMLLSSLLSADGYHVIPADSGERALAAVAQHRPDLILLDIRMAGLDGFEVCRRLKARPDSRDIPIMFISAATEGPERVEALELGAVDFVSKPIQKGELRARLRTHLELRRLRVQSDRQAEELRRANVALEAALGEKVGLLKEVHHRVKNNLALIISLMRLEASRAVHAETQTALKEMQSRIRSVVVLNEVLYRTEGYTHVNLADYLRQIATHLFQAQTAKSGTVKLSLDLEPFEVETKKAIPCGLIVNELMTNSLKHAFGGGRPGEIQVALGQNGTGSALLRVSDSGPGLPKDFEGKQGHSLGLQLISDLARQLRGDLKIGPGAAFAVTFPV